MKQVISIVVSIFVLAAFAVGCDEEPAEHSDEQQAVEQQGETGDEAVVDDIRPADGEVVEDQDDAFELEGAQWLEAQDYGIKVQVPDTWELAKAEEVVSANSDDDSTTVVIGGSDADETLQAAIDNLKDELSFTDVDIETSDPTTLGGYPAHEGIGSAVLVREDDIDEEIQFLGYAINTGNDENVVLMIFSEATMYEAKRDTIDGIAQTVSRI